MYTHDSRTVLTLDAGGTNFVFSALQGYRQVSQPVHLDAAPDDIDRCLNTLEQGFRQVMGQLDTPPAAISFAFPGPADYVHGVIGDLPNFPAFRGGIALGPWLQQQFGMPVYINNDGNLFAYGEALAGFLPMVNSALESVGSPRRYNHLLGITLGTGFGGGVVHEGVLYRGDNGCGGDVWCMRNSRYPHLIAEESVSIRAVRRVYAERSGCDADSLTPFDIFRIAEGFLPGNSEAARASFYEMGQVAGEAVATALDIVDGLVVLGGGVAGAAKYILPGMMEALQGTVATFAGNRFPLLQMEVFNWEDEKQRRCFLAQCSDSVCIPHTDIRVPYQSQRCLCIGTSRNGASASIMYGAYAYALSELDKQH